MRSRAETSIETLLREAFGRAGVNARAQVRIGRFTVDFLIADRIVVEADGDYWHAKPEVAAKDRRKDAWLSGHGYKIIHVSEKEILSSVDKIVARMELVAR